MKRESGSIKPLYLYKQGDECTSVTGGWTTYTGSGSSTKQSTYMVFGSNGQSARYGGVKTVNSFNLSKYEAIGIKAKSSSNASIAYAAYINILCGTEVVVEKMFRSNADVWDQHPSFTYPDNNGLADCSIIIPISSTLSGILDIRAGSRYAYTSMELAVGEIFLLTKGGI